MLQGSLNKNNSLAWRVQSSGKRAGNYSTADYILENTGSRELNYSFNIGYKMPQDKVEAFYSYFSTKLGVYSGSRIGNREDLDLRILIGRPLEKGIFSYDIGLPYQDVKHHLAKLSLESNRSIGKFNFVYAFQKNHRQEYDFRRGAFAHKPILNVNLITHTLNLDYQKKHHRYFKNYFGMSISRQENHNIPGTGINSILPNFISHDMGIYLSEELKKDLWIINAGIRLDYKTFLAAGYNRYGKYYSADKFFKNFSYNLGVEKLFGKYFSIISNIGLIWRPPSAIELFSDGVHHGSAFYIYGDEKLNIEKGLKWSTKFNFSNEKWTISANVFLQKIKGFIYQMPTNEYRTEWSGEFRVFRYKASDAFFRGLDVDLKYQIFSWLNYDAKASIVYADNLTENYYFPSISPENILHRITFKSPFKSTYFSVEHLWTNKQKRFSQETDLLPASPPAYHLFNMSLGTELSLINKNDMSISLTVENLLNRLYKDYTDHFRYFGHAVGRNFQFRINYNF